MTIEQFRDRIINDIIEVMGDEYKVTPYDATKNNGLVLHGITIRKEGKMIAPTVYIDNYFSQYNKDIVFEHIVNKVIVEAKKAEKNDDFDGSIFKEYEKIKDNLFVKLVCTEKNKEMLKSIPSRKFLDLSMIVYCDVSEICHMNASVTVNNEHLNMWHIGREEILDKAYENTRLKGCIIRGLSEIIPDTNINIDVYVMSNRDSFLGAVCMTFHDKLDEFLELGRKGVYIIPSSIHEVILVPETTLDMDEENLNSLIKTVNENELSSEEVLAEHAYYYSATEGYLLV